MLNKLKSILQSKTFKKRLPAVLLCLLIAAGAGVSLYVYRQQRAPQQPSSSAVTAQQDTPTDQQTRPGDSGDSQTADQGDNQTAQQPALSPGQTTPDSTQAPAQGGGQSSAAQQNTQGNAQASTPNTDSQSSTTPTQPTTITVYVQVECKVLLDRLDKMTPEKAELVPKSGVLLNQVAVSLTPGQTAFEALQKACGAAGIAIDYAPSNYYVRGIGGLYEKDCGAKSGWLYFVNGTMPGISCGYYTLGNGDTLRFSYTV